jgi:hypothetical protein
MIRLKARVAFPIVGLLIVLAGCSTSTPSTTRHVHRGRFEQTIAGAVSVSTISPSLVQSADLPAGYPSPSNLAVSSDGSVWFWQNSATETTLFHWIPTEPLTSIQLGSPTALGLITGSENAITVDSSGRVWLGANLTLMSYNQTTRVTNQIALPSVPSDSSTDQNRPPPLRGLEAISTLAADSNCDIAIALSDGTQVLEYNTNTSAFTGVTLPTSMQATDLAFAQDGTLGVTLASSAGQSGEILLRAPSGSETTISNSSSLRLTADGNNFILDSSSDALASDGSQTPDPGMTIATGSRLISPTFGGAVASGPDGQTLLQTETGLSVLGNATEESLTLPTFECGLTSSQLTAPSTTAESRQCASSASFIQSAPNGSAFFVPLAPGEPAVDYLPAQAMAGSS